jgi:hypothetical protein
MTERCSVLPFTLQPPVLAVAGHGGVPFELAGRMPETEQRLPFSDVRIRAPSEYRTCAGVRTI